MAGAKRIRRARLIQEAKRKDERGRKARMELGFMALQALPAEERNKVLDREIRRSQERQERLRRKEQRKRIKLGLPIKI